jgi:uncharacterized protein (DUF58 family)
MEGQDSREASIFVVPLVQFLVGVLLFLALLHGQRTLIVAAVLILGLMTLAKIWSRLSSSGVTSISTVDKDRLFPGERFTLKLRTENAKFLPVWLRASLRQNADLVPYPEGTSSLKQSGLLSYQGVRFRWELDARKRGVYQVGPPRLRIGDYLGFFLGESKEAQTLDIIVYPKLILLKPLLLPRRDFFGVPGPESPVQDPVYILGTRDYQHNQPARHIHWKASARHGRLQEKTFEPTVQEKVLLVLDVDQFAAKGAADVFERTLEVMASLAVQLDQKGYPLGLATNGKLIGEGPSLLPVARGPLHLSAILEILARVRMVRNGALIDLLRKGLSLTWGVSCVHFSYHQDASTLTAENYLTIRRIPPLFVVCLPPETSGDACRIQSRICCLDELRIEGREGK